MNLQYGNKLRPEVQRDALNRFVHRMTIENRRAHPAFAVHMDRNGYRMRIITDKEWLSITEFHVNKDGTLSGRHKFCWNHQPIDDIATA